MIKKRTMLRRMLSASLFALLPLMADAQQDDPIIMTVNGTPVTRSEFEYSYNKNNAEGVVDKKTIDEYVDLFANYKLKVVAAEAAGLDTLKSFKDEFATYRDQQIRPSFITDADVEREAQTIYRETQERIDTAGGLVKPAHILLMLRQTATAEQQAEAKQRIDSIYQALKGGADFADMAKRFSDDKGSAANGGELPWIQKGQTLKEFEETAYAMKKGELSKPFLSPAGYHIILLRDKGMFFPYDSVHADILQFIEARGLRNHIIDQKLDSLAKASTPAVSISELLEQRANEMAAADDDLKNLIREYHDGLLLYEISNRTVWEKASKDEAGQAQFFKKNKKRYTWDSPRFKGIAYHVKDQADVAAVRNAVKKLPFDQWTETLRQTFNNDSVLRIRVEKGIFKQGDNALIDREVFKVADAKVKTLKDFPIDATFGTLLKAPKEYQDVKQLVVADYQEQLEKEWVAELRKKYPVVVNREVLATVNKH